MPTYIKITNGEGQITGFLNHQVKRGELYYWYNYWGGEIVKGVELYRVYRKVLVKVLDYKLDYYKTTITEVQIQVVRRSPELSTKTLSLGTPNKTEDIWAAKNFLRKVT